MENELKPCPFCGGVAEYLDGIELFGEVYIECKVCGVLMRHEITDDTIAKDEAYKKWNRRI